MKSLVRDQLKVPGIGLLVAGAVNLLTTLSIVLIEVFVADSEELSMRSLILVAIALSSLVMGIILVKGASRMLNLQSHRMAVFAAVVAILPCAPGFMISLPFGIWALIVLSMRNVQSAFASESERQPITMESDSAVG